MAGKTDCERRNEMSMVYNEEDAKKLTGEIIICNEHKTCDRDCEHKISHTYNDMQCFSSCGFPEHEGICIPLNKKIKVKPYEV